MTTAQGHLSVRRKSYGKDGKDGVDGATGKDGIINEFCGEYDSSIVYVYTAVKRQFVTYMSKFFCVYQQGKSVPAGHTPPVSLADGATDGYWLVSNDFQFISASTAIIDGGNIGGFSFSRKKNTDGTDKKVNGSIVGVMKSQASDSDGASMLTLDSETGEITAKAATLEGATIKNGDITMENGETRVVLSSDQEGMVIQKIAEDDDGYKTYTDTARFTGDEKSSDDLFKSGTNPSNTTLALTGGVSIVTNSVSVSGTSYANKVVYGNRQNNSSNAVDMMSYYQSKEFSVGQMAMVTIKPTNSIMASTYTSDSTAAIIANTMTVQVINKTTGNVAWSTTYDASYTPFSTSEEDGTEYDYKAVFPGVSITLNAGTYYMAIYSKIQVTVMVERNIQDIEVKCSVYPLTISYDYQSYKAMYFGNGLALGISQNQHFQTIHEGGVQKTEFISGNAGVKVSDDVLKLKIKGIWYTLGVNGSAITLTATSE
jgi:hypothetical protein